jgi:hypothetical protein
MCVYLTLKNLEESLGGGWGTYEHTLRLTQILFLGCQFLHLGGADFVFRDLGQGVAGRVSEDVSRGLGELEKNEDHAPVYFAAGFGLDLV